MLSAQSVTSRYSTTGVNAGPTDASVQELREVLAPARRAFSPKFLNGWFGDTVSPRAIELTGKLHSQHFSAGGKDAPTASHKPLAERNSDQEALLKSLVGKLNGGLASRQAVLTMTRNFLGDPANKEAAFELLNARSSEALVEDLKSVLKDAKVGGVFGRFFNARLARKLQAALVSEMVPVAIERKKITDEVRAFLDTLRDSATAGKRPSELKPELAKLGQFSDRLAGYGPPLATLRAEVDSLRAKLQSYVDRTDHLKGAAGLAPDTVRVLGKLTLEEYVQGIRAFDQVLATVPTADHSRTLELINKLVQEKRSFQIIQDMADGKAADIDGYMPDASWDEAALALKGAALRPDDEKAQRALAVQHQCRIAGRELNAFMRAKVEANRKLKEILPLSAFNATLPSKALGQLLAAAKDLTTVGSIKNAIASLLGKGTQTPSVAAEMEFMLVEWGRLSLYDPQTESVDAVKLQAFLEPLKFESLDPVRVENYLRQGFRNLAEVKACTQRIVNFSRAVQDAPLVSELVAQGSQRFQAQEILRDMLAQIGQPQDPAQTLESIDGAMHSAMAAAIDKTRPAPGKEYQGLMKERQALAAALKKEVADLQGANPRDLRWLDDPVEVLAQRKLWKTLDSAFSLRGMLKDPTLDSTQKDELTNSLTAQLKSLRGFSVQDMRHYPDSPVEVMAGDLDKTAAHSRQMRDLIIKDARLLPLDPGSGTLTSAQKTLTEKALNMALLQEIANGDAQDWTPAKNRAQILERLAGYGLGEGWGLKSRHEAWTLVEKTLANDQRTAKDVLDKLGSQVKWTQARQALCDAKAARVMVLGDPQQARQKVVRAIESAFEKIEPGQSCDISFGATGSFSVGLPVAVVASASLDVQGRKHTGLTVSRDEQGAYEIQIHKGYSVTMGLSMEAVANLLSLGVEGTGSQTEGHVLTVPSRAQCEALVKALCTGDERVLDLLTDARVQAMQRRGKEAAAHATAQVDLAAAALQAGVQASKGVQVDRRHSAQGTVDIFSCSQQVKAGASGELALEQGGAGVEAGASRTLVRTLHKQFGRLTDECGLTVSAQVFKGGFTRALGRVLPPSQQSKLEIWGAKVAGDGQSLEAGSEVFLTLRLKPEVVRQANQKLEEAQKLQLQAAVDPPDQAKKSREQARTLREEADALTRDWSSYLAEGIGWASADSSELSAKRGAYDYFATAQTQSLEGFIPFDRPLAEPLHFGTIG